MAFGLLGFPHRRANRSCRQVRRRERQSNWRLYSVIPYDESFRPALKDAVTTLNPASIAIDYSENDPAADGLTHGMYLELMQTFAGTPFADRFISAERVVGSLRGRKSATEVERIRQAIRTTEKLYADLGATLAIGQTESEIADKLTRARKALGLGTSWETTIARS